MLEAVTENGLIPETGWILRVIEVFKAGSGRRIPSMETAESLRNEKGRQVRIPLLLARLLKLGVKVAPRCISLATNRRGPGTYMVINK